MNLKFANYITSELLLFFPEPRCAFQNWTCAAHFLYSDILCIMSEFLSVLLPAKSEFTQFYSGTDYWVQEIIENFSLILNELCRERERQW